MPRRPSGRQDLIVFLAVLTAGTVLVLRGVAPESLAAVAVAVSGLYAAWRGNSGPPPPSSPDPGDGQDAARPRP